MSEQHASRCSKSVSSNCEEHGWPMAGIAYGGLCIEGRLTKAEATIQRVRLFCVEILKDYDAADTVISVADILDLLDGGDDE